MKKNITDDDLEDQMNKLILIEKANKDFRLKTEKWSKHLKETQKYNTVGLWNLYVEDGKLSPFSFSKGKTISALTIKPDMITVIISNHETNHHFDSFIPKDLKMTDLNVFRLTSTDNQVIFIKYVDGQIKIV